MAVFVDLVDEDNEPRQEGQPPWTGRVDALKPLPASATATAKSPDEAHGLSVRENPNRNSMTQALGCYPIVMSVVASIDLNTLDNLSRTCRQIRGDLLQYRKMLLVSTMHCTNEHLPVDPSQVLRYRARAGNWFYMEDAGRSSYSGKSGQCARDLVSECRRCGTIVCRNCAAKAPAPIVMRDRHRRLCDACVTAPLGTLVKPQLGPEIRIDSEDMERAICKCGSEGVWLCHPCGRSICGDDSEYKGIWRWRNQYTDVLGGLGTGIGEGDRGVICGRETACCAAREREQETDGDADEAYQQPGLTPLSNPSSTNSNSASASSLASLWTTTTVTTTTTGSGPNHNGSSSSLVSSTGGSNSLFLDRRTPSPALKPGYERHEIEGIGGVMKKLLVCKVKVGACVPEWEDERAKGEILGREVKGTRRSWCGWCRRVIPSGTDYEVDRARDKDRNRGLEGDGGGKGKGKEGEGSL